MEKYRGMNCLIYQLHLLFLISLILFYIYTQLHVFIYVLKVSDDEDETHPNIDTPSLFRWRHQARVERMEELKKERETLTKKKTETDVKIKELGQKIKAAKESNQPVDDLEKHFKELEVQTLKIKNELEEFQKKEKV